MHGFAMIEARRRRVWLTMTLCAFGVGFMAGVLTIRLAGEPDRPAQRVAASDNELAPGAYLDGARWLSERPAAALAATTGVVQEAAMPGPTLAVAAMPRTASRVPAAQIGPARAPAPPIDSLASRAEVTQEARLAKASLLDRPWATEQVVVRRGDTLMDILQRARIDLAEAHAAVESLRSVYDPRRLRAGQELAITADTADDSAGRRLFGLAFDLSFDHQIRVIRGAGGRYDAAKVERPQRRELVRRAGSIDDSLYLAAERADVPQNVILELIRMYSWDVDFQRDLRRGDRFEAIFEEVSLEDGSRGVRGGEVIYAALELSGELLDAYRFEVEDGEVEYFDRSGRSLRKFLMRTPVDGARLSSRFGMRKHPILGYSRMHKGVDFAAPTGTPIYAAGGGRIVAAGRNGGYGNYVKIRHTNEYSTAYAHLSRIAKGIRPGQRVRQGQVIGYVGSTGRSTGPHLHYEVMRNDRQINPLSVKQPPSSQLAGADLERFRQEVARIDRLREELASPTQVASRIDERRATAN